MAFAGRSLSNVICEANGKVKCTNISLPSSDFKTGKMSVSRFGNSSSFSVGIQQTVGHRLSKKIINLKPHQFTLSTRPNKLTITFAYDKTLLSIVEANEAELKALIDLLNSINEGKFSERHKEISSRPRYISEPLDSLQQNNENQPLNSNIKRNTNTPMPSSEANQFLSTRPFQNHSPSRLASTTPLGVKRRHTPFSSGSANSFYGSSNSSPSVSINKPFTSPLQEKSSTAADKSSTKSSSSFYGGNSPSTYGRKTIGLPKQCRLKPHLPRESSSFSFKQSINKPIFAQKEVQLTGFSNLGNTCYMNAILQSLLGIETFAQDLCNKNILGKIPVHCLYKCTYGLLACKKKNCQQDLQSLHLKKFKKTISQAATRFSGHLQHDAHEFLCQVLDQLKDDVNTIQAKSEPDESTNSPAKEEIALECPVRRTFECGVMHTITCKGCGESLYKEEIHHVFSLDLPSSSEKSVSQVMKKLSIDKLIEDYFEEEELEYCCEECGCKEAVISHRFSKLPRVLILHLKRYDFNAYTDKHAKKHNDIQINRFIDIGKLCNTKTTPPLDFKVEKLKLSPVKTPMVVKRPLSDPQSDDDFVSYTTPKVRRKLHQEFNTTPQRERKVQIIDYDSSDCKDVARQNEKEIRTGNKTVEKSCNSSEFSLIDDFDDIDNTPLEIQSSGSEDVSNLVNMSEEQQIEWAKKESLKSNRSRDCGEQVKPDVNNAREKVHGTRSGKTRTSTATEQSVSGNMDVDTENMDIDMDCSDEDLLTAVSSDTDKQESLSKDKEDGLKGGTRVYNTKNKEIDVDYSDEHLLTFKDTRAEHFKEMDSELCGLEGGARVGDAKISVPVRHVTYISDDSEHSGLENKNRSSSSTKSVIVNSSDSSDTSLDEGVGMKTCSKDNSLCSLMDRRPVLSKFSGDLLIESDSNENSSKNDTRGSFTERKFIKSVASPFNAKFQPPFQNGRSYLATKYPVKSSPSPHINRSSQTNNKPIRDYKRTEVQSSRPQKDVVQPEFDDEEVARAIQRSLDDQVPSSDDEQVKRAIELSIQESRMDYYFDQENNIEDQKLSDIHHTEKALSPQRDAQNNSIDSGYQTPTLKYVGKPNSSLVCACSKGDEDSVTHPYRLVSVVSHLGNKSFAGHYISDVYDCVKDEWTSYDDLNATKVDEHKVRYGRSRDGYIFFYLYKQCVEAVKGQPRNTKGKR